MDFEVKIVGVRGSRLALQDPVANDHLTLDVLAPERADVTNQTERETKGEEPERASI